MSTNPEGQPETAIDGRLRRVETLLNALIVHLGVDPDDAIEGGSGRVGQALPRAMGAEDIQRAFGISAATFYRHQADGEYRPFELPRRIGKKRYSGEKVQSFLRGRQ